MSKRLVVTFNQKSTLIQSLPGGADSYEVSQAIYQLATQLSRSVNIIPESIRFKVVDEND